MDEYPDSVLQLLNIQPEEIEDFSDKECARYALLLARATDKCEQSLLPCDSILLSEISDNNRVSLPKMVLFMVLPIKSIVMRKSSTVLRMVML